MPTIYAPWEDSPGKGSRDFIMEPANEWGSRELTKYLGGSWGDPYGIFSPDQVSAWKSKAAAPYNTGVTENFDADTFFAPGRSETPFDFSATPFTEFTTDQLNSYLGKLASNAAGSKLGQGEAPFLPTLKDYNGQQMVSWGNQNSKDKNNLGTIAAGLVGPALMSGVGALSGGFGLADILKGVGVDASWGVNPSNGTGANMDFSDFITNSYNPGEFTGSMLPGGSNSLFGELGGGMVDLGGGAASVAGAGWSPNFLDTITNGIQQLGSSAAQSAAKSALAKVMSGQGTQQDLMSLLGSLGATGLGVLGSNQQSNALENIANQSRADRQPFLNASLGWLNDPSSFYAGAPAQAAMKGVLQGLSVNGNPANNPTAMAMASDAGLKNWQNAVTGFGNIGLAGQDSRNSLLANAAQADSGVYDALGYGLNQLTQPKQSLSDLARAFGITGLA